MEHAIVIYIEDHDEAQILRDAFVLTIDQLKKTTFLNGAVELIAVNRAECPAGMLHANGVRAEARKMTPVEIRYSGDDDDEVIRDLPDFTPTLQ